METPLQRVSRLLGALETLSAQQSFLVGTEDFKGVLALIDRSQPLVNEIARLMLQPGVSRTLSPALQKRAQEFFDRQRATSESLAAKKACVREQLDELAALKSRTHRLRGAYGTPFVSATSGALAGQA